MPVQDVLAALHARGLTLKAEGDFLRVSPRSAITDEIRVLIREHKTVLLAAVRSGESEADALVREMNAYGERHGFTPADVEEALRVAMTDPAPWLAYLRRENETVH
jgi:hypothetical protein